MRISVVGYGSIGRRHADNLKTMGHTVIPVDIDNDPVFDVDCAFICSPTGTHFGCSKGYLDRDIPVFIEKPLTCDKGVIGEFSAYNDRISMVGCNLRFHSLMPQIKDFIASNTVLSAMAEFGFDLRKWREGDYRKSYSADYDGGIILDAIHEIDYLAYLFGDIHDLKILSAHTGLLEIKNEDIAECILSFDKNILASVHMDYIVNEYHRSLTIITADKRTCFDLFPENEAYKKEVAYFLECVEKKTMPMNNIAEASVILKQVLKVRN